MPKAELKPAELFPIAGENVREIAEKGLVQSREAYDKFSASAKEAAGSIEASATVVAKGLSEFNAKAFEAVQTNVYSTFDYLASVVAAKSPTEAVSLQSAHVEKQIKSLTAQAKDLTDLAQKIAKEAAEPLKGTFEKVLKPAA